MKRRLIGMALGVLGSLSACAVTELRLQDDPRVLRGVWEGDALEACSGTLASGRWSDDGKHLLTYDYLQVRLQVWNADSGRLERTVSLPQSGWETAAVAGDRLGVLTEGAVRVLRVSDGQTISEQALPDRVSQARFDRSLGRLAYRVSSPEGSDRIRVRDIATGALLFDRPHFWRSSWNAWDVSADGRRVLLTSDSPQAPLQVWELEGKQPLQTFPAMQGKVSLSADGRFLIVSLEQAVQVFRVADGQRVLELPFPYPAGQGSASPQYRLLGAPAALLALESLASGTVQVYDLERGQRVRSIPLGRNRPLVLSPDGLRLLSYTRSECEMVALDAGGRETLRLDTPPVDLKPLRLEVQILDPTERQYTVQGTALLGEERYTVSGTVEGGCDVRFRSTVDEACRGLFRTPQPMLARLRLQGEGTNTLTLVLQGSTDRPWFWGQTEWKGKQYGLSIGPRP